LCNLMDSLGGHSNDNPRVVSPDLPYLQQARTT
jgi:hypothetical protein